MTEFGEVTAEAECKPRAAGMTRAPSPSKSLPNHTPRQEREGFLLFFLQSSSSASPPLRLLVVFPSLSSSPPPGTWSSQMPQNRFGTSQQILCRLNYRRRRSSSSARSPFSPWGELEPLAHPWSLPCRKKWGIFYMFLLLNSKLEKLLWESKAKKPFSRVFIFICYPCRWFVVYVMEHSPLDTSTNCCRLG